MHLGSGAGHSDPSATSAGKRRSGGASEGSEPFGYVDVEFGLLGVPSVGAAIGGLGKMPGESTESTE